MKVRALVDNNAEIPAWLEWRIIDPYKAMNDVGLDVKHTWLQIGDDLEKDVDLLVIPRLIVDKLNQEDVSEWFTKIKSNGTKLLYEADDDIWSPDYVTQISRIYWNEDKPLELLIPILDVLELRRNAALWTLQQCDFVTVSVSALHSYVRTLTDKPVFVVPNAFNIDKFKLGLIEKQKEDVITIGWSGGRRNELDIVDMVVGWERIADTYDNVKFVVGGWLPDCIKNSKKLSGRVEHYGWKRTSEYASSMQVDIGCCAVNDNPFSNRKSPIKAWEFSIAGAAVVAQGTVYQNEPAVLTANNADDWYSMLSILINEDSFRNRMCNYMQQYVHFYHDLKYEYIRWIETYQDVTGKVVV